MFEKLNNILKVLFCKKIIFCRMFVCAFCIVLYSQNAWAGDPSRLNQDCEAGDLPKLTHDANCTDPSCETKKGCLDVAPVAPANRISSTFGPRTDPVKPSRYEGEKGHGALDFAAPLGAPIYAAADGVVSRNDCTDAKGYGNRIQIIHDNGYETLYAHMNCFATYNGERLKVGQRIQKGTIVGFVGNTGSSTGPHLHYEVRVANTKNKKDPLDPEMQGVMCKVPEEFVDAVLPTNGTSTSGGSGSYSDAFEDRCTSSGCAKMYPADNISQLHHKYESAGNPCAFNKCLSGDIGGCSYGSSQLECNHGSMKAFLTSLQTSNPSIWARLGGGSVEAMNARACSIPPTDFANKWQALCSTDESAKLFEAEQEKYMQKTYYDSAVASIKKNFGIDFNTLAPELQMSLFSAAVALGSPGGVNNLMNSIKNNIGDPAKMSEAELLEAMYQRRDFFYASSSEDVRVSVQGRNAREGAEALESLKIREAWEAEQKKPKNEQKSYEEVVKEVTGKDVCQGNESATFSCAQRGGGGMDGASSYNSDGSVSTKTCSISQYLASYGKCMMCPIFEVIFNTASVIAKLTFTKLATPIMVLVVVAWALWLAFQTITFASSFTTKDAPTFIKEVLTKTFVVLIVVLFLQADSNTFFAMLMEPIFNTGFRLAEMAVSDEVCTTQFNIMQDGGLPASMGQSILCTIEQIQNKLARTMALGAATTCIAVYVKGKYFIFPSLTYLFSGGLIMLGAFVVMIGFPFLLVDCIFQLTVACALLPAAIGCYPFKTTSSYVKHVWNAFMNAMFNFVFMSLVILILTTAIDLTLKETDLNALTDMDFQDAIITRLFWGGVTLIKIIFILLLAWVTLGETGSFAGQFSGALSDAGIGRKLGGMAMKGAKDLGGKAWGGAKAAGSFVAEAAKEKIGDIKRERQSNRIMNSAKNGGKVVDVLDDKGNVIGKTYQIESKTMVGGRKKTESVTIMNNGTKMVTVTKEKSNGEVETTRSDGYLTQKEVKNAAGEVVSNDVQIVTNGLKAIRNKDGTMNQISLDLALKNSAFSAETIKAAAMLEYAKQSFKGSPHLDKLSMKDLRIRTDENGKEVFEIAHIPDKNSKAPKISLSMTMPSEEGNRPLVELSVTDNKNRTERLATDGMINRKITIDAKGRTQTEYGLSEYYQKRSKTGVNYQGEFSQYAFGENAVSAFSKDELERAKINFAKNRINNRPSKISGIQ